MNPLWFVLGWMTAPEPKELTEEEKAKREKKKKELKREAIISLFVILLSIVCFYITWCK